jgi:type I restriction enzyme S subunit
VKLPVYPKTSPNGLQGLGKRPTHWEVIRGRFVMQVNPPAPRLRMLKAEDEVSFVPMEALGEHGGLNLDQTRTLADVSSGYTEFQDGDVVVAKITPCFENGKAALARGLVNSAAYGTTELHVLRAGPMLNRAFLFYTAISDRFRKLGESEMYGAGGQKRVPPEFNKDFPMTVPPVAEQQRIAAFLDWKTGQIDALIARKQELREKLKEKRIAVITQAVTRGLNPVARLRDSGIPWLGKVPEHWEVCQIKRKFQSADYGISESLQPEGAIAILRMGNIENGKVVLEELKFLDEVPANLLLRRGDLLYNRTNSLDLIGKVGMFTGEAGFNVSFASYLVRIRTEASCVPEYFAYLLNTEGMLGVARSNAFIAIGQCNLNPSRYGQLKAVIPPKAEQEAIVAHLESETAKLDELALKTQAAIERLTEYRTALISAATTGKIDVRNVKIPEPVA